MGFVSNRIAKDVERMKMIDQANSKCERVEQTKLHIPGEQRGNCFSATVAGLLKIPIESIPEFATKGDISWQEQFNEWLRQFGLAWFPMAGDDLAGECQQLGIQGLWSEMSGKSPRFDVGHSCAAKDGRLAWDPHPSQSGLERPIWWHGVFIVLMPWNVLQTNAALEMLLDALDSDWTDWGQRERKRHFDELKRFGREVLENSKRAAK